MAEYTAFARAALPHYGLSSAATVQLLSLSENGTFLARDGERAAVLRVHRPGYQSRRSIESELAWMRDVREQCGVATPQLIPAANGDPVVAVQHGGERRFVDAMTVVPGATGEESTVPVPFEALGRICATMHRFDEGWRAPAGFERFRWDLDAAFGATARWGDWRDGPGVRRGDRAALEAAEARIRQQLEDYGAGPGRFGLVHADLRLANVMVGADGAITVIDFDDCGWGWYLHDLGSVLSWIEHEERAEQIARRWLAGYLEARLLDDADFAMVPVFVMLRRMMLTGWLATHPLSPPALAFGSEYGRDTGALARRFLDDPGWFGASALEFRASA